MKHRIWTLLGPFVLGSCMTAPAAAQPRAPAPAPSASAPGNSDPGQARIGAWRSKMLRKKVGLDEKTAEAVERILLKYRPERQKHAETVELERRRLDALLDLDSADQAAYSRSLRTMFEAQAKVQDLQRKQADELSKVLSPKQQAKLARSVGEVRQRTRHRQRERDRDSGRGRRDRNENERF